MAGRKQLLRISYMLLVFWKHITLIAAHERIQRYLPRLLVCKPSFFYLLHISTSRAFIGGRPWAWRPWGAGCGGSPWGGFRAFWIEGVLEGLLIKLLTWEKTWKGFGTKRYLLIPVGFIVAPTGRKFRMTWFIIAACWWGMRLKVVLENECGTNKLWIGGTKRKTNDIWEICGKYILMCPVAVTSYVRRKRHCSLLKGTAEAWHARLHFQRTSSQDSGCQNFPYLSPPYVPPRISRWPVLPTAVKIIVQKQVEGFEKFPELIWKFRRNVGKTVSGSNPLPIFTKWGVFKKFC